MKNRISPWYALLIVALTAVFFIPILWIFLTSIKTTGEIYAWPPIFLPKSPTLVNYSKVLFGSKLGLYILNSLLVCSVSTLIVVFLASLADT